MKRLLFALALLAAPSVMAAKAGQDWLAPAGRDGADVALDEFRKPMETLTFFGLKKGAKVLDFGAGGGYYSVLMARIVGAKGSVVALTPAGSVASVKTKAKWTTLLAANPNVRQVIQPWDSFPAAQGSYSFVLFHLEYHDLYWESARFGVPKTNPDAVLKRLFGALKPGSIVGVVDHMGKSGDTRAIVDATHRIDPEVVKADFARAGFKLVGESQHLRDKSDDYSKNVFDTSRRNHTDRFVLKFKR
ncbi:MAG: hypothetical protein RIS52_675 [Pseudomonadota bacterium]|jgi:predicted methyltransferase